MSLTGRRDLLPNSFARAVTYSSPCLIGDILHRVTHEGDVFQRHVWIEGERQRPVANAFRDGKLPRLVTELFLQIGREVNGPVVDDRRDAAFVKPANHCIPQWSIDPNGK